MVKKGWSFLFVFLLSCNKPYYHPPCIETPPHWRMDNVEGEARANIDWWQAFEDPVLTDLILRALQGNQDIKEAAARVMQFAAQLGVAQADLYPSLYLDARAHRLQASAALPGGNLNRNQTSTTLSGTGLRTASSSTSTSRGVIPGISRIFNDFFVGLRLFWELDFWNRIRSATLAAYDEMLSSISARQAVVLTVVQETARGYLTLRGLDAQLVIAEETYRSRLKTLELAKLRFELGETSELEVKQQASQVEVAAISILVLKRAIPKQENLISILLGEPPQTIPRGKKLREMSLGPPVPAGLPSDLLTRRPDIMEAEQNLMAAQARITQARALFFPQITLTGLYGFESTQLKNLLSSKANLWDIGVNLTQMVFDAGKTASTVKLAKAIACENLATYRQTILRAFQEVEDALVSIVQNRELVAEHKKQVVILKDYLRLAHLRYLEGEADYLSVLDSQRDLFDAELSSVHALTEELIGIVDLYSALGGGWVYEADNISQNSSCASCDSDCDAYKDGDEESDGAYNYDCEYECDYECNCEGQP